MSEAANTTQPARLEFDALVCDLRALVRQERHATITKAEVSRKAANETMAKAAALFAEGRITGADLCRLHALRMRLDLASGITPSYANLTDLATRVVSAETGHAKAAAALASAQEARDAISARLADLAGKRQEIVVRRAEGDVRDDDASALALLDADTDGLKLIVGRHNGTVAEAQAPVRQATDAAAAEDAVEAHAEQVANALEEALRQLWRLRDEQGGGLLKWRPGQGLMNALTRAHHGRMW